jgi:hypothetical protein
MQILKRVRVLQITAWLLLSVPLVFAAKDVPVPMACTPDVNRALADVIASHTRRNVDNVMVCGIAAEKSRLQAGGPHGNHHVTTLSVEPPDGQKINVQVVTNDALDGVVVASANDQVFAYGQAYIAHGLWATGVHDVHCSTHPSANNGWVVVAGVKTPVTCLSP